MKHQGSDLDYARSAARWAGVSLTPAAEERLDAFAAWLVAEAVPAGGLGPNEAARIWPRHIADSLTFAFAFARHPPEAMVDLGTGVGLPGIPLAIALPDTRWTLADRGGRRIRLLERVVEILGLTNASVVQHDVTQMGGSYGGVVMRGALPPHRALPVIARLLDPEGSAVIGLSRRREPPERRIGIEAAAGQLGFHAETVCVPTDILDAPSWLLKLRYSDDQHSL